MDQTDQNTAALLRELTEKVRRLSDCEEIRQVLYRYARGVDRVDGPLVEQSYHEDAYDSHGNWRADGRAEVMQVLMARLRSNPSTMSCHNMGNILIDLQGDTATVETYFIAYARTPEGDRTFTRARAGRYLDQFERRDGAWRIRHRQVIDDWSRLDEVVSAAPEVTAECAHGTRNASDPSYRLAGFPRPFGI